MASGTISMSSSATGWKGSIEWYSNPNTSKNTSYVYASVTTWKSDGLPSSATSGAYFKGTLYVNDESIDFSFQQQEGSKQWQVELDDTVSHNSDGSGECYIYCVINAPSGVSMYNKPLKGGGTYSLDTISRESSISSASDVYFGNPCRVTWVPQSTSFYYKLNFSLGNWSYTTGAIRPGTTDSYTYKDYTIPLKAAEQIPSSASGQIYVSLYSYQDSSCRNQIGSSSYESFTATLADDVVPVISSYGATVDNSDNTIIDEWGIALVGHSRIRLTASASGVYGSSVKSFTISGDYKTTVAVPESDSTGSAVLDYVGSKITTSGNKSFIITCTDSRGRKSSLVTTDIISVLPYSLPKSTGLSMTKEEYGDDNVGNDHMVATATWEYDPVEGHNSASAVIYYKTTSATDWTLHSGTLQNGVAFTLTDFHPKEDLSYNYKIVVTDALGNSSDKSAFSATTVVLLDFKAGGKGLGIGKICETDGLEVSMDSTFFNSVYMGYEKQPLPDYIKENQIPPLTRLEVADMVYPVGSIYMSVNGVDPATIFGGEWIQITGRFLLGVGSPVENTDIQFGVLSDESWSVEAEAMGGEDYHTLTTLEMPSHQHAGVRRSNSNLPGSGSTGASTSSGDSSYYTDNAGGGESHNNMPPYFAVYIWQRVA